FTWIEKFLGFTSKRGMSCLQRLDQLRLDTGRFRPEGYQAAYPLGGADRTPALARLLRIEPDEKIAREKRLFAYDQLTLTDLFGSQRRQVAFIALLLQIEQRTLLLPGLGVDDIPVHGKHFPSSSC